MKTVFFFVRVTLCDLVVSAMRMLPTVSHRKRASNDRSMRCVSTRFKGPTDHACPVVHDVQSHTVSIHGIFGDSLAVILNQQGAPAMLGRQLNPDLARAAMLDRIIHCFLSDVIKMCGHGVIVNQYGSFALKTT